MVETSYSIGNSKKAEYSYDSEKGRLKIMNAVNGGNFEFGYMENTSLQNRITYPNGMVKNTSFEEKRNLITGINYQNGANLISNYSYENDVLGRRNNIGITYDNTTKSNDYNYNPRSEVIGAHGDTLNQTFDYDNIGNRITSSNNDITTNYSANNLNQYETVGDFVPLFDADGNQTKIKTSKGEFLVEYNGENRPVKFTNVSDSTFITMKYDYMGRRGGKLHFNSQGQWQSTAKFFYKDYTLIEESSASNDVLKEFVWDPTAGQATKPLYMRVPQTGRNLLYLHDANKNVTEVSYLATANGIGAHYEYDSFGNTITSTRNTRVSSPDLRTYNPFRFSSEYHDSELDLIYYNYRHYNPQTGRWVSRDPIAEQGGKNLYSMVKNDVINEFDLLGKTTYYPCGTSGAPGTTCPISPPLSMPKNCCPEGSRSRLVGHGWEYRTNQPSGGKTKPNGCSVPRWLGEDFMYWSDVFKSACDIHDECYDSCGEDFKKCNEKFHNDMRNICLGLSRNQGICFKRAIYFKDAVSILGHSNYDQAQDNVCKWAPCPKEKKCL